MRELLSRRARLGAIIALGLAILLIVAGAAWLRQPGSERHLDGEGPLGDEGGPAGWTKINDSVGGTLTAWSYGIRLCRFSGDQPAVLDSVSPDSTVGSGFSFLGAKVRAFTVDWVDSKHTPIISVAGYPPPTNYVPDELHDVKGFEVTSPCNHPPEGTYTELIVGLGRVGDDGGGWKGIDVAYTVGGQRHVLVLDIGLFICGPETPCQGSTYPPETASP